MQRTLYKHQNSVMTALGDVGFLLRLATFTVFAGRAWQHLFGDAPFRTLLWDQAILGTVVEALTGASWQQYVTSETMDNLIQGSIRGFGLLYLLCALVTLFIKPNLEVWGRVLIAGVCSLLFLALLYCKEKFFHVGQFFEYSLQFGVPLLFYQVFFQKVDTEKVVVYAKVLIALTFICHGLYAVGYYPRPGNFVDMTIDILAISEADAHHLLYWAGIIDLVLAIGIFLPRIAPAFLLYAFVWGLMTAAARLVANFQTDFMMESFHQWTFEVVYRLPHALVPLWVLARLNFATASKGSKENHSDLSTSLGG